jgi:hypothetical protein
MTVRAPRTVALGAWLAARGPATAVGIVLAIAGALASVVAAVALGGSEREARLPTLASSAVAWSAGVMIAFGASLRVLPRDREEGILELVRARSAGVAAYVRGRVVGLVLVLAVAVGGATLVAGGAAISLARPSLPAVRAAIAALVYALAFAATMGPVAIAALGARTRAGGYLTFLAVLTLPEILARWTAEALPRGWHELTSIPAALDAVRAGVAAPGTAAAPMARALAALAAVVALALLVVAARVRSGDVEASR